jgi:farnesyl diphosphate synthase
VAFQIADDRLDAEGDAATLAKRVGKDAGRNKATFVAALGLEGARGATRWSLKRRQSTRRGRGRRGRAA